MRLGIEVISKWHSFLMPTKIRTSRKIDTMKNITIGLEQTDEESLAFEVSDEAIEIAASSAEEKANFTLGACSGLSVCPG